jgi:tyrosine decarboxylase / aspartate 1-decarboxylase
MIVLPEASLQKKMYWPRLTHDKIRERVFKALSANLNYREEKILGIPATYLDQQQFSFDAPFLKEAAFLSVLIHNPNHIGCHTYAQGEKYFRGTQQLELDLLRICAEEILGCNAGGYDGYVASGGTEANIQAQWMYRNYFETENNASPGEIGLLFSEDAHYSVYKGCNLLNIRPICISVDDKRRWDSADLEEKLNLAHKAGVRYLIVHLSMGTTLFGSVDDPVPILSLVKETGFSYFVHVDAAFGGFIYPFVSDATDLTFQNTEVHSITIDAHKMLQTPYGTGIFLCRKGLISYTRTSEASYVQGTDFTLCGSRSGANAVAIWMVLMSHGSEGWKSEMAKLVNRSDQLCAALDQLDITYYRYPAMNVIALKASDIPVSIAQQFHLVADDFRSPRWWKIVTMMHLEQHLIDEFIEALQKR